MNKTKRKVLRFVVCALLVLVAAYGGFLYNVNNTGQDKQQSLIDEYESRRSSTIQCMVDGFQQTSFAKSQLELYAPQLTVVAMTQFVDGSGDVMERTPETVFSEVVVAMEIWGDFTVSEVTDLSNLVVTCGGVTSPVYDSAVNFRTWIDNGSALDRMIRQQFPTDELDVDVHGSGLHVVGPGALDWLTRTVNPYTGSSLEVGFDNN